MIARSTTDRLYRPTWLEIDLAALHNNVRLLRNHIGNDRTLFAVVKANAYGHGASIIAPAALAAGADRLAVAAVNEGIELRQAGILAPILVMGYTPGWQAEALLRYNLTAVLYDLDIAHHFDATARATGERITVHVKIDTGMRRLGLLPDDAVPFFNALAQMPGLDMEGLYTHFSTADDADKAYTQIQLARLETILAALAHQGQRPRLIHSANSAATLTVTNSHFNAVRCGISLYGLHPSPTSPLPAGFRPVMRWVARVAQVKALAKGDAVSYGNTYIADRPRTIAVIPVGYADGFPRSPRTWGSVLIDGQFAPIRGRVCMDQSMVDVTEILEKGGSVHAGDEVVLIGAQGQSTLTAEDVATRLETINYEVVSRLMARLPRIAMNREE